jgi:ergothioneine biosynthesis protein EgtB
MPTARTAPAPPPTAAGQAVQYQEIRQLTEALAAPLSPEDQTVQSMPDVSPTKWHRAHTTWFFETFLLEPFRPGYAPFHPDYRFLFNSYYEAVGPRHARPERGLLSRPSVTEVTAYRSAVDEVMTAFLSGGLPDDQARLVELGLHHEQQHQELLLMDIKHVLSLNPLQPTYVVPGASREPADPAAASGRWISHPGGVVDVGHAGDGFCFDNETPRHPALLPPFAVRSHLVTCGEWLEFMDDGGYQRPELWMSDGWGTARTEGWKAPAYWSPDRDGWKVHTLGGSRPVDDSEPVVHVSWYEADAFARWAGHRLPSEAEWETVATERLALREQLARADGSTPEPAAGLDREQLSQGRGLHPASAGGGTSGDTAVVDVEQWQGTVWQWTASSYEPYPGFRPASGAVGEYNGKFMVNQKVLRGGACVTPAGHTRATYRNFFYPASRWPFCGLRLATDA